MSHIFIVPMNNNYLYTGEDISLSILAIRSLIDFFSPSNRELVEELHPLMKEALERRPEVKHTPRL